MELALAREWVWMAWHIDGMPYGKPYLELTMRERAAIVTALRELIEKTGDTPRNKDFKK